MIRHYRKLGKQWCFEFIATSILWILRNGLLFFGFLPLSSHAILLHLPFIGWIVEILGVTAFYSYSTFADNGQIYDFEFLITSILFFSQMSAHFIIMFDSLAMYEQGRIFRETRNRIDNKMKKLLHYPFNADEILFAECLPLLMVMAHLTFCHILIGWSVSNHRVTATLIYWFSLLSALALQFRILGFLATMSYINVRLGVLVENLKVIGENNVQKIMRKKFMFNNEIASHETNKLHLDSSSIESEKAQIATIKTICSDLYSLLLITNDCYGWSLVAFMIVNFIDFVTNAYGFISVLLKYEQSRYVYIQKGGFLYVSFMMITAVCWSCQKSFNYGRQIGCMVFKLIKLGGKKNYNLLVDEFSLQALHQQFTITAKDFFDLNLKSLGSMVAAVVTYLVILIQFMITEKGSLGLNALRLDESNSNTTNLRISP